MSYTFAFSYCSWGSQGNNTEVVCDSLLQWTTFCQTSPLWPVCLGWPYLAWLSFMELDHVVYLIRLASFLWLWFQSVCPLKPFLSTYCLLGFLLPWTWGISSQLLQQSADAAPYLGCGVSPHGCCSWPWMWGTSSRLPLLTLDVCILYHWTFTREVPH